MSLGLFITTRCDLECRYCFNWESDKKQEETSLEYADICRILAVGREEGHRYLTITGGEPFLHKDIFKIIDYAHDLGYLVNILTNGLYIDEQAALELRGKYRLRIRVSLEGADKDVHEYFRGKNTFDRARNAIQLMVKNNIDVGIGFTVYEENLQEMEKAARLCIELGCAFIRFTPVVRLLKGKQARIDAGLHENTLTKIIEIQVKYRDYIEFPGSNQENFLIPIEAITAKRCEAGCNFFAINPGKILLPCPLIRPDPKIFKKEFTGKEDFAVVNRHMEELFADIAENLSGSCAACEFNGSCAGGCLAEKLSFDLTLYDEQPVCAKRILKKVENKFNQWNGKSNGNVMQLLKKSWLYGIANSKEKGKDESKYCFRKAPFWSILFKCGNQKEKRGEMITV
jgi:radical SAM protein with 4Fe4S-binding SPASM domain